LLLDAGADVNAEGGEYGHPLQAAATKGSVDVAKLLLDTGSDVNAKGKYYRYALQAAAYKGNVDLVKLLLGAALMSMLEESSLVMHCKQQQLKTA
jgi:ankyrin repeat protein